jgi:hypothetical protein
MKIERLKVIYEHERRNKANESGGKWRTYLWIFEGARYRHTTMPRSSSSTPSDSSHDSESPRKRAPSVGDDAMSVDLETQVIKPAFCQHIKELIEEPQALVNYERVNYEKALSLAGVLLGAGRGRTKRRKVSTIYHHFRLFLTRMSRCNYPHVVPVNYLSKEP